jgi:hypothetical protein
MRRFIIARIARYYLGDQVSEDELGGGMAVVKREREREREKLLRSVNLRAGRK